MPGSVYARQTEKKDFSCAEPTGKTAFKGESVQEIGGVGPIYIEMWLMDECVQ